MYTSEKYLTTYCNHGKVFVTTKTSFFESILLLTIGHLNLTGPLRSNLLDTEADVEKKLLIHLCPSTVKALQCRKDSILFLILTI